MLEITYSYTDQARDSAFEKACINFSSLSWISQLKLKLFQQCARQLVDIALSNRLAYALTAAQAKMHQVLSLRSYFGIIPTIWIKYVVINAPDIRIMVKSMIADSDRCLEYVVSNFS